MNKIRVFEAFSGYGSQAMALKKLQLKHSDMFEFEFVGISEIEPSAIKAYNAVHGDTSCYGDISKIDWNEVPDFDLFTMSSPCQDFSVAGRQAGAEEGSGTRSSLLWECRKAIVAKRPKYILFENVSAVVSKKFIRGFHKWMAELESYGYTNFAKVLNSKDYGVPQNRERIFMLSIWGGQSYHFPEPFRLEKRIKDILEPSDTVDESFYFSAKQLANMFKYCDRKSKEGCGFQTNFRTADSVATCDTSRYGAEYTNTYLRESALFNPMDDGTSRTIKAQYGRVGPANLARNDGFGASGVIEPVLQQRLSLYSNNAQAGRVYDEEGISPCLDTCSGGNRMPKILTSVRSEDAKELRKKGIEVFANRELVPREDGMSNTITTVTKDNLLIEPTDHQSKIRSKVMPNGNIRFFQDDDSKSGVSEMQIIHPDRTKGASTEQRLEFGDNVANCITTVQKDSMVAESQSLSFANLPDKTILKDEDGKGYLWQDGGLWRVRKLVPMECGRLMGCSDSDIQKMIDAGISRTALYTLFGNSIVVDVLYHIFRKLWIDTENESAQKSLFDF